MRVTQSPYKPYAILRYNEERCPAEVLLTNTRCLPAARLVGASAAERCGTGISGPCAATTTDPQWPWCWHEIVSKERRNERKRYFPRTERAFGLTRKVQFKQELLHSSSRSDIPDLRV
ncbi:hypothetical protein NPIL_703251 [Nephila pilipes]|uniref:Uncharacterized protein n=1 Tax=Nephila pilipes TaxID=299642 RepID=A0A8X6PUB7_NEPPI|nr:hypothetical protein NPIL_703251 [Nephila pilipes]